MKIAHFGTFDVENYGDLLFPLILERRLADLGQRFIHVSPRGGPAVWSDCVPTVAAESVIDDAMDINAVVVGGGHILHASPTTLDRYDLGGVSPIVAYPSLWLGAAHIAARHNAPLCWNAPGVLKAFTPTAARLVHWAASVTDYLAVRDSTSRSWLADAGVVQPVHVVPDTAIEVSRLWAEDEVDAAYANAFADRGRATPDRTLAFHLNSRFVGEEIELLAARLDRICQRHKATPILIAIGPCHGDAELQRRVAQHMTTEPLVVDQPQSLREVAACIARSDAYLGSSLHGVITACSFGKPGIVVVPQTAGSYHKFVGFLEPFQLTRWLCESWEHAEHGVDELLAAPASAWQRVLTTAMPTLDEHWGRLRAAVGATDGNSQRVPPVDKQAAYARFSTLESRYGTSSSIFAGVISEQAQRALEARKEVDVHRRKVIEAQKAYNSVREQLAASQRATDLESQRAAEAQRLLAEAETARQQLDEHLEALQRRFGEEEAARQAEQAAAAQKLAEAEMGHQTEREALQRRRGEVEAARQAEQAVAAQKLAEAETARQQLDEHLEELQRRLAEAQRRFDQMEATTRKREASKHPAESAVGVWAGNGSVPSLAEHAVVYTGDRDRGAVTVDIVICVHDALDDVKRCLASLVRHTNARHRVIIVDDGSEAECRDYLTAFTQAHPQRVLIRNNQAQGYTKAANQGLRRSNAVLVVLLNSDTIVTPHWLERLVECAQSDPKIGIAGPLSNAASYQSIPERFAPSGGWALNPLPPGWSPDQVAGAVATMSTRAFPRVPFVNGFCFAITRAAIDSIGAFDEEGFPEGYGEEYDYCLRAAATGFELAVADHAYVYHAKSRSYSPERRRSLVDTGNAVLFQKYGRGLIEEGVALLREEPTLAAIREVIGRYLHETSPAPDLALTGSLSEIAHATVPPDAIPAGSYDRGQSSASSDGRSRTDIASLTVFDREIKEMTRELLASNDVIQELREQLAKLAGHPAVSEQQRNEATSEFDSGRSAEGELQEILLHLCDQLLHRADVLETIISSINIQPAKEPQQQASHTSSAAESRASRNGDQRSPDNVPAVNRHRAANSRRRTARPRVTVFAWDVAHNPLGRAYLLADMLRDRFDVQLVGATFPRYGTDIWEPLRNSNVPIVDFKGHQFPHHFTVMQRIVESLRTDVVVVSKPRLPSYELGILVKLRQSCPLILDIDDYELSFFRDRTPLTLDQVRENPRNDDFFIPHGSLWTRYCETIIPLADSITTSSEALRSKYGGIVLPHARDERVFDPALYDRDAMRARYGYGPDDRVILFLGTPRAHKGVLAIVAALRKLDQPHYKVCIIGNVVDHGLEERLRSEGGPYVQLIPNVSFSELPAQLIIGDLICLLQDSTSEIAKYQTPAKFTDALSMTIPILATDAGPLADLAARGLVELLGSSPLDQKIHSIFSNYDSFKSRAIQNRAVFLSEYSYACNSDRLERLINESRESPSATPTEYEELMRFHREEFMASQTGLTRQTAIQETHVGPR